MDAADPEGADVVNVNDANYVITCNDAAPCPTDRDIKVAGRRFADRYPMWGA